MISIINKIRPIYDIGGLVLLYLKVMDKITGRSEAKNYLYKVLESADSKDYPRLISDLYVANGVGEFINLDEPKTFNEKMQWLKAYDSTPQKTRLADKYLVREWVKEKIGDKYLIPLLGVWNSFDEIVFDELPNSFVLKCNHGSGMNMVVVDKTKMDYSKAKKQFDEWMNFNYAFISLELQYKDIPRKIIAEKYIEQIDGNLLDYKIHVCNGEPKIVQVIGDRDSHKHTAKECFFTTDWIPLDLMYHTYDSYENIPERPDSLNEMLNIASVLGEEFKYVRVDLFSVENHILFGEMTFTPASGYGRWGKNHHLVDSWIKLS